MTTIRVVVADDDQTMRRAIVDVLDAHGGFSVVADVATGADLPDLVTENHAQLVVLDVRMPSGGAAAARALRERAPHTVVVAVSASNDVHTVAAMFRSGATGFLAKGHLGTTFADDLVRNIAATVCTSLLAETATTTVCGARSRRARAAAAPPDGIRTSSTTSCAWFSVTRSGRSAPVATSATTLKPPCASSTSTIARRIVWSSSATTTRMVVMRRTPRRRRSGRWSHPPTVRRFAGERMRSQFQGW